MMMKPVHTMLTHTLFSRSPLVGEQPKQVPEGNAAGAWGVHPPLRRHTRLREYTPHRSLARLTGSLFAGSPTRGEQEGKAKAWSFPSVCFAIILLTFISYAKPALALEPTRQANIQGVVLPAEQYKLGFRQAGPVTAMPREGVAVKKGELLARIDDTEKQLALAKARVALQAAKVQLEMAEHGYAKNKRLTGESVLSDMALKEAEFSVRQAQAMVAQAKVDVKTAQAAVDGCAITAPVDGVVTRVAATMGEWAGPGQPVIEMADLTTLQITTDIPPAVASTLQADAQTEVQNEHGIVLGMAKARSVVPYIDAASGLQRVVWEVAPQEDAMLAGRYVTLAPWETADKSAAAQ